VVLRTTLTQNNVAGYGGLTTKDFDAKPLAV
jgi:hypothetical protein